MSHGHARRKLEVGVGWGGDGRVPDRLGELELIGVGVEGV